MSVPGVLNAQDRGAPLEKHRYMDGSEEGAKLRPGVTSPKKSLSRVACGTAGPLAVSLDLGACGHVPAALGIHDEAKEYSRCFAGAVARACKSGSCGPSLRKSGLLSGASATWAKLRIPAETRPAIRPPRFRATCFARAQA